MSTTLPMSGASAAAPAPPLASAPSPGEPPAAVVSSTESGEVLAGVDEATVTEEAETAIRSDMPVVGNAFANGVDSSGTLDPLALRTAGQQGLEGETREQQPGTGVRGYRAILTLLDPGTDSARADVRALMNVFDPIRVEFSLDTAVFNVLDRMRDGVDREKVQEQQRELLLTSGTAVIGAGLSAGFVTWLLRSGLLMATAMSASPLWRPIDPVPILASSHRGQDGGTDADA